MLRDYISKEGILLNEKVATKEEAVEALIKKMADLGGVSDIDSFREAVWFRESQGTTGVGHGIAIPHGKSSGISMPKITAMLVPDGIDFESLDGEPVYLIFLIGVPEDHNEEYLKILANLSGRLGREEVVQALIKARDEEDFIGILEGEEEADGLVEEEPFILAVTSCPTGVAHTYMGAASLKDAASEMGIAIKVETQGAGGAKDIFTEKDIDQAEMVIIAASVDVDLDRFKGKRVLFCPVADAIHRPKDILRESLSGDLRILKEEKTSFKDLIYKSLMEGVSKMLPFAIGGGMLIALSFIMENLGLVGYDFVMSIGTMAMSFMVPMMAGSIAKTIGDKPAFMLGVVGGFAANFYAMGFIGGIILGVFSGYILRALAKIKLAQILKSLETTLIYPVLGLGLLALGIYFLKLPLAFLNNFVESRLANMGENSMLLTGLVLGTMMSVDMGGPINKAAYLFATSSLVGGPSVFMASSMVGGMVPPLVVGFVSLFIPRFFTGEERGAGLSNFITSMTFVTETAIPFVAKYPKAFFPGCLIGSGVGGMLAAYFRASLPVPHGGIFAVLVAEKPLTFVFSLVVGGLLGALVSAFLLYRYYGKLDEKKDQAL